MPTDPNDLEGYLREQLVLLHQSSQRSAQPLIDRLIEIEMGKPRTYWFTRDQLMQDVAAPPPKEKMVHLLLVVFVQYGLSIELVEAKVSGPYLKSTCTAMAREQSKPLPLLPGDDARWQTALCVELQSIAEPQPITEPYRY